MALPDSLDIVNLWMGTPMKEEYTNAIVDRTIDRKLTQVMKNVVKLGIKKVTFEDFRNIVKG